MIEHLQVNLHLRRFFRRSLRTGARDHFKRADARRTPQRERVVGGMAGDLVEAADDGALRGGGPGCGGEEHEGCCEKSDHGVGASVEPEFLCPCAKLASTVSRSTAPWVYMISPPGGRGAPAPPGSMAT